MEVRPVQLHVGWGGPTIGGFPTVVLLNTPAKHAPSTKTRCGVFLVGWTWGCAYWSNLGYPFRGCFQGQAEGK